MAVMFRLRLFGQYNAKVNGISLNLRTEKSRALLAYLALSGHTTHSRAAIANLFWPEFTGDRARANLRITLKRLRDSLDNVIPDLSTALIDSTNTQIHFTPTAQGNRFRCDVTAFQALIDEVNRHDHRQLAECGQCLTNLASAIDLYQGDLLLDLSLDDAPDFQDWALHKREQLHKAAFAALSQLIAGSQHAGDHAHVATYARRALMLESWREEYHKTLIRAMLQMGQRRAALAQLERYRKVMQDEWHAPPSPEILELFPRYGNDDFLPQDAQGIRHEENDEGTEADLASAPVVERFYGRAEEMAELTDLLVTDPCRVVAILGMGGMGKTTLAVQAVRRLLHEPDQSNHQRSETPYRYVIWRSVLNAPPLERLIEEWLRIISGQALNDLPDSLDLKFSQLFHYLRHTPTLLILDNLESLMQSGQNSGLMRQEYEAYDQFLQLMGGTDHASCLLVTSREAPLSLARMRRSHRRHVHTMTLGGLSTSDGLNILSARTLSADETTAQQLMQRFSGNPLALELVAEAIDELYGGDVHTFLDTDLFFFEDIRDVLDQQTRRLSKLERTLLSCLAVERKDISRGRLIDNLRQIAPAAEVMAALLSLERRSMLERHRSDTEVRFSLQNVLLEYHTDLIVNHIFSALSSGNLEYLTSHPLLRTQAEEFVIDSQKRMILQPICERVTIKWGKAAITDRIRSLLADLRDLPNGLPGYAAGNLVNLLIHLEADLQGLNLAGLEIREVDFRNVAARDVDLSGASLQDCTFTDSFGGIYSVALSSDGRYLAAGTKRGELCLWRTDDRQPLERVTAHSGTTFAVAFSPDDHWLATCGEDGEIRLWHTDGATTHGLTLTCAFQAHARVARSVAFSTDGRILASGGEDGRIALWHMDQLMADGTPELLGQFDHGGRVFTVAIHPAGDFVASAGADRRVFVWQIGGHHLRDQAEPVQELTGHEGWIQSVAFSPDGRILASGAVDTDILLWLWQSGECYQKLTLHDDGILSLAFNPRSSTLASAGHDGAVRLWRIGADDKAVASNTLTGHVHGIWDLGYSRDGRLLASGADIDQQVRLWRGHSGHALRTFHSHVTPIHRLAFHPTRPLLASGSVAGELHLWDVTDPEDAAQLDSQMVHEKSVSGLVWHPKSDMVVSTGLDGDVRLCQLDMEVGKLVPIGTLGRHPGWVTAVAVSPDGHCIVSAGSEGNLFIRFVEPHNPTRASRPPVTLSGHKSRVWSLGFSADGSMLYSAGERGNVFIWDMPSTRYRCQLESGQQLPILAAVSGDAQWIAIGLRDGTVQLWNLESGHLVAAVLKHQSRITGLSFTPDNCSLATVSAAGELILWSVTGNAPYLSPRFHTPDGAGRIYAGNISSLVISENGSLMAYAGDEVMIRLWNAHSGERLSLFRPRELYAGMNITRVTGITEVQKASLRTLDAVG